MILLASDALSMDATIQNGVPNLNQVNLIGHLAEILGKSEVQQGMVMYLPDTWKLFQNNFNEVRKLCWSILSLSTNSFGFDTFQGLKLTIETVQFLVCVFTHKVSKASVYL